MGLLLDSNALIWYQLDDPRLGAQTRKEIAVAIARGAVCVSAITFWEMEYATRRKRLALTEPIRVLRMRLLDTGLTEIPLDGCCAILAAELDDFHGDPMDRYIVATAVAGHHTIATSDKKILAWSGQLNRIDTRR